MERKDLTDEQLMVIFKMGNNQAFDVLFDKYKHRVFRYIYNFVGRDTSLAEDVVQEIFINLFLKKQSFNPEMKFSTWLYTMARNACINRAKSKNYREKKMTFSLDQGYESLDLSKPEKDNLPAKKMEQAELRKVIEEAIGMLPEKYRETFILHELEGLSYSQLADILETNEATIRTHYHRARNLLKEKIEPYLEE